MGLGFLGIDFNFIDWFSFNDVPSLVDETTSLGQFAGQYAAVQTNWVYTIGAVLCMFILLAKRNKKWYWYGFFAIVAVMSFTSVGMHTANYGELTPGVLTTKLLGSYIDMSFTELMAWSAVSCFVMEFYRDNLKKRNVLLIIEGVLCFIVLAVLTYEVFVVHNRPLWIGGRDENGLPYDMGGDHGGLSLAEFGCFLTALPILYVFANGFKKMEKVERSLFIMTILAFLIGFIVTSLYGDNEINSFLLGNIHTHSLWHILTALGTILICFWVDQRTMNDELRAKGLLETKTKEKKVKVS